MTNETQENSGEREVKHPWLAVLLSKMIPGAGQIYAGAKARGILFIVLTIVLLLFIAFALCGFLFIKDAAASRTFAAMTFAAFFVMLIFGIYNLFDAYRIAKRHNAGHVQTDADAGHRKSWLAAFLSALFPGIGQFYNGQVIKGIAFIVLVFIAWALKAFFAPLFIVAVLVYVLVIKDAFDSAETLNGSNDRFFRQRRAVVLLIVIMIGMQETPFAVLIKNNILEAFKIPSGTMYPTLKIGDHFLLAKSRPFFTSPQRGDIVVFPYPENPTKNFVKRVIGLGGDKIQIVNGEMYINDQMIPSKKLDLREESDGLWLNTIGPPIVYEERIGDAVYCVQYLRDKSTTNAGPWLVPQDSVFVMGDNRDNSQDSRVWGPVKSDTVKGKALKIYWSWDRGANKVRWERIGETIH